MHPIRTVGLIANSGKREAPNVLREAARRIRHSGRTVVCDAATATWARLRGVEVAAPAASWPKHVDVILVVGGDGTMLRVVRELNGAATPVLGVNLGGLGFLTDVPSSALGPALEQLWGGAFTIEHRARMAAEASVQGQPHRFSALNDVVISRGIVSRLVELAVTIDGEALTTYRCDGLIVSSPTGSTAYSLSAGGAVVCPQAEVLTLTPICPHTLSNRSVVVSLKSVVEVAVVNEKPETILSADGQSVAELRSGDSVSIRRSRQPVRFIRLQGTSFFQTLRSKLHWRGSTLGER